MASRNNKLRPKPVEPLRALPIKYIEDIQPADLDNNGNFGALNTSVYHYIGRPSDKPDFYIPTPQIRQIPDYDAKAFTPYKPPVHYIKYHKNSGSLSHNIGVHYDILRDDIAFIQMFNDRSNTKIKENVFILCIETLEKAIYRQFYPDFIADPKSQNTIKANDFMEMINPHTGSNEVSQAIYAHWAAKRKAWRKALMRPYQAPPSSENSSPNVAFRPRVQRKATRNSRRNDLHGYERITFLRQQILFPFHMLGLTLDREKYKAETFLTESQIFYLKLRETKGFKAILAKDDNIAINLPPIQLGDDNVPTKTPSNYGELKILLTNILPSPTYKTPQSTLPIVHLGPNTFHRPRQIPPPVQYQPQQAIQQPRQNIQPTTQPQQQSRGGIQQDVHHHHQHHHHQSQPTPANDLSHKVKQLLALDNDVGITETISTAYYQHLQQLQDDYMIHHNFQQQMATARQNQQDYYWLLSQERIKRQQIILGVHLAQQGKIPDNPLTQAILNAEVRRRAIASGNNPTGTTAAGTITTTNNNNNNSNNNNTIANDPNVASTSQNNANGTGKPELPLLTHEDWVQLEQIDKNIFGLQLHLTHEHHPAYKLDLDTLDSSTYLRVARDSIYGGGEDDYVEDCIDISTTTVNDNGIQTAYYRGTAPNKPSYNYSTYYGTRSTYGPGQNGINHYINGGIDDTNNYNGGDYDYNEEDDEDDDNYSNDDADDDYSTTSSIGMSIDDDNNNKTNDEKQQQDGGEVFITPHAKSSQSFSSAHHRHSRSHSNSYGYNPLTRRNHFYLSSGGMDKYSKIPLDLDLDIIGVEAITIQDQDILTHHATYMDDIDISPDYHDPQHFVTSTSRQNSIDYLNALERREFREDGMMMVIEEDGDILDDVDTTLSSTTLHNPPHSPQSSTLPTPTLTPSSSQNNFIGLIDGEVEVEHEEDEFVGDVNNIDLVDVISNSDDDMLIISSRLSSTANNAFGLHNVNIGDRIACGDEHLKEYEFGEELSVIQECQDIILTKIDIKNDKNGTLTSQNTSTSSTTITTDDKTTPTVDGETKNDAANITNPSSTIKSTTSTTHLRPNVQLVNQLVSQSSNLPLIRSYTNKPPQPQQQQPHQQQQQQQQQPTPQPAYQPTVLQPKFVRTDPYVPSHFSHVAPNIVPPPPNYKAVPQVTTNPDGSTTTTTSSQPELNPLQALLRHYLYKQHQLRTQRLAQRLYQYKNEIFSVSAALENLMTPVMTTNGTYSTQNKGLHRHPINGDHDTRGLLSVLKYTHPDQYLKICDYIDQLKQCQKMILIKDDAFKTIQTALDQYDLPGMTPRKQFGIQNNDSGVTGRGINTDNNITNTGGNLPQGITEGIVDIDNQNKTQSGSSNHNTRMNLDTFLTWCHHLPSGPHDLATKLALDDQLQEQSGIQDELSAISALFGKSNDKMKKGTNEQEDAEMLGISSTLSKLLKKQAELPPIPTASPFDTIYAKYQHEVDLRVNQHGREEYFPKELAEILGQDVGLFSTENLNKLKNGHNFDANNTNNTSSSTTTSMSDNNNIANIDDNLYQHTQESLMKRLNTSTGTFNQDFGHFGRGIVAPTLPEGVNPLLIEALSMLSKPPQSHTKTILHQYADLPNHYQAAPVNVFNLEGFTGIPTEKSGIIPPSTQKSTFFHHPSYSQYGSEKDNDLNSTNPSPQLMVGQPSPGILGGHSISGNSSPNGDNIGNNNNNNNNNFINNNNNNQQEHIYNINKSNTSTYPIITAPSSLTPSTSHHIGISTQPVGGQTVGDLERINAAITRATGEKFNNLHFLPHVQRSIFANKLFAPAQYPKYQSTLTIEDITEEESRYNDYQGDDNDDYNNNNNNEGLQTSKNYPSIHDLLTRITTQTDLEQQRRPYLPAGAETVPSEIAGQYVDLLSLGTQVSQSQQYLRFQDIPLSIPNMNDLRNPFNRPLPTPPPHPMNGVDQSEFNVLTNWKPRSQLLAPVPKSSSINPTNTTTTTTATSTDLPSTATAMVESDATKSTNDQNETQGIENRDAIMASNHPGVVNGIATAGFTNDPIIPTPQRGDLHPLSKYPITTPILPRPEQQESDFVVRAQKNHPHHVYADDLFAGLTKPIDMNPSEYFQTHIMSDVSSALGYQYGGDLSLLESKFRTRNEDGSLIQPKKDNKIDKNDPNSQYGVVDPKNRKLPQQVQPRTGTYIDPQALVPSVNCDERLKTIVDNHQTLLKLFGDITQEIKNNQNEFEKRSIDLPSTFIKSSAQSHHNEAQKMARYEQDLDQYRIERALYAEAVQKYQQQQVRIQKINLYKKSHELLVAQAAQAGQPAPQPDPVLMTLSSEDDVILPIPTLRARPVPPEINNTYSAPLNHQIETVLTKLQSWDKTKTFLFDLEYEYALSERLWYGMNKITTIVPFPYNPHENIAHDGVDRTDPYHPFTKNPPSQSQADKLATLLASTSPGSSTVSLKGNNQNGQKSADGGNNNNTSSTEITKALPAGIPVAPHNTSNLYSQYSLLVNDLPLLTTSQPASAVSMPKIADVVEISKAQAKDLYADPQYFITQQAQSHYHNSAQKTFPSLDSFSPSLTMDGRPFLPSYNGIHTQVGAENLLRGSEHALVPFINYGNGHQDNNNNNNNNDPSSTPSKSITTSPQQDSTNTSSTSSTIVSSPNNGINGMNPALYQTIQQLLSVDHLPQLHTRLESLPLPLLSLEPSPMLTADTHPIHPFVIMHRLETIDFNYAHTLLKTLLTWRDSLLKELTKHLTTKANAKLREIDNTNSNSNDTAMSDANNNNNNDNKTKEDKSTLVNAALDKIQLEPEQYKDDLYIALQWLTYYHIQQHLCGLAPSLQLPMIDELLHYSQLYYQKFDVNIKVGQRIDLIYNQTHFSPLEPSSISHSHSLGPSLFNHPHFSNPLNSTTHDQNSIATPHPANIQPPTHPNNQLPSSAMLEHQYFFRYGQLGTNLQQAMMSRIQNPMYYNPDDTRGAITQLYTANTLQMLPPVTNIHRLNTFGLNNNAEQLVSTFRNTFLSGEVTGLCFSRDDILSLNGIPRGNNTNQPQRGPIMAGHIIPRLSRGDREVYDVFKTATINTQPLPPLTSHYDPMVLHKKIINTIRSEYQLQLEKQQRQQLLQQQQLASTQQPTQPSTTNSNSENVAVGTTTTTIGDVTPQPQQSTTMGL